MGVNNKKPVFLFVFIALVLLAGIGLIAGFYLINAAVVEQFGEPAPNLSQTQRLIYLVELYVNRRQLTSPNTMDVGEQAFEIAQGESVSMVCFRLEQGGLIEDAELLRIYLVYTGLDRHLKAGQFKLIGAMSPVQIAAELMDVTPQDAVVSILPGWRIEEVAANVAGSGLAISADAFIQEAYTPSPETLAHLPITDVVSLEGFLFPGSYVIARESGLDVVLEMILTEFTANADITLVEGFIRQGLSIYEAVILASIVEKEAVVEDEKPMIASVFYNRLAIGMRLETDPTVQYALGYHTTMQTWWKVPLSLADLAYESAYNTYHVNGLPPTPICNPGLGALRAVAFPAETPYFFFRSACDGSGRHNFAITFDEHLDNACD